jgi:hypothetical protein
MPTEPAGPQLARRAERRRQLYEEVERKKQAGGFQDGAEALQALRDLFGSDEEWKPSGATSDNSARRGSPGTATD